MPKGHALSQETIAQICVLYEKPDLSIEEIAERLGVSKATVSTVARERGLGRIYTLSPEKRREIGRQAAKGELSQRELAERYGISQSYAGRLGRKYLAGEL